MLGLLIGYCALFGLVVGSFLNVVIYRVPGKESMVSPRSACPTCGVPIAARDNVPIFSWLFLRGRCRNCDSPISMRYPLIEAATAGLFAGVAARIGFSWTLPAYLVVGGGAAGTGLHRSGAPAPPEADRLPGPRSGRRPPRRWRPPSPATGTTSSSPGSAESSGSSSSSP